MFELKVSNLAEIRKPFHVSPCLIKVFHDCRLPLPSPRNWVSFVCKHRHSNSFSKQEQTQKWDGLKLIRGVTLLKDLSTWGIGGPCNYFVQVHNQTQLVSAVRYTLIVFFLQSPQQIYLIALSESCFCLLHFILYGFS